jgi:hypothetical protein
MGSISADTFRRIYLLYLLAKFQNGAYGLKRVHKVAYIPERSPGALRPFAFRKHLFGQYSETLDDIKDQLISMGYVTADPLATATIVKMGKHEFNLGGNRFFARVRNRRHHYRSILAAVSPEVPMLIDNAVREYGYRKEQELVDACYQFPEFQDTPAEELIFDANLPDRIEIDLPEDECSDLELSFNPAFIESMIRLNEALETQPIEWGKVRKAEDLSAANA